MSDWTTSNAQWSAWTREALAMPPRHDGFGRVDDELTERLAQGGFLGGLEETTITAVGPDTHDSPDTMEAEETKVRAAPAAFDLDDEEDEPDAPPVAGGPLETDPEAAETMIRGVVPVGELEVGLADPEGGLEVGLSVEGAESQPLASGTEVTQPEGLFIPSLTRPSEPAAPQAAPQAAPEAAPHVAPQVAPADAPPMSGGTVVALNPLNEGPPSHPVSGKTQVPGAPPPQAAPPQAPPPEAPPASPDPGPAVTGSTLPPGMVQAEALPPPPPSGVTGDTLPPPLETATTHEPRPSGGQIVMGGGSAEESMTAGVIGGGVDQDELSGGPGPAPRRQKVVIGAPAPAPAREDVTAEIDATDIFDQDEDDAEPQPAAVAPDAAEGVAEEAVEEVVEEVADEAVEAVEEDVEELQGVEADEAPSATPGFDPNDVETTQRLPASMEPPSPPKPPDAPKPPPAPARPEVAAPAPAAPQPSVPEAAAKGPEAPAQPSAPRQPGWPEEVFTETFAALTRDNHPKTAKGEVEFFIKSTSIKPGARVLDVGCGDGAHALVLAQKGFDVTAVDLSGAQLARAEQARAALGANAKFQQGDMRDLQLDQRFAAILCIGSTFGYYDDEENRAVLRQLAGLLAPGGRLLLQVFNRDHMISRLPARSWWQGHGCLVLDEAQMNYFNNRLAVHRTAVFEDGRQFEHNIQIRTYNAHELGRMCVDAGLRVVQISGSRLTRGRFYGASSADIWLTVEPKP